MSLTFLLDDPGLVPNSPAAEHCVHACFQMVFRTIGGGAVPSFAELDRLMRAEPGRYTWEHSLIAVMPSYGFCTRIIWGFDLQQLATAPAAYLMAHYGEEIGAETIANSNLTTVAQGAAELLDSDVEIEHRIPTLADLKQALQEGFYVLVTLNQRILQADPGYVAHNVLVFGFSPRGVIMHNPGPPATRASEVAWDLFERAWAYPNEKACNLMMFKPC